MNIKEIFNKNEIIDVSSYLQKCGVKDTNEFLVPLGQHLDDYHSYKNILDGVTMLKYHLLQNDGAYILCDSGDTDGFTSTIILYQYMKALNSDWDIEILLHSGKQRGLQDEELLEKVLTSTKGLLIIPDSGSNDGEQVDIVYEKTNTDVLVLDHHSFSKTKITKGCLVNNQDEDSNVSRNGSGCLVTHKFLQALDAEFNKDWSSWFIDMVALSLISDSMNMADEQNRTYYHFGLENIDCINNEFLKEMFLKFIGDKEYTQKDISFKIIPKINSVCRSKNQELKQRIIMAFLGCDDTNEVLTLCAESHKNQIDTVNTIIEENLGKIKEITDNNLIVLDINDMPRSYSGLVAGKIMGMCDGKPTIVGKVKDGYLLGSLRSPIPLREQLDNNELVEWANGHEDSCGICILQDNVQQLVDYYNGIQMSYEPCIEVLKSYSIKSIPQRLFALFEPYNALWGHCIPIPQFHITLDYVPSNIQLMGKTKTTLKLSSNGIDIMFFFATKQTKCDLGLGYMQGDEFILEPSNQKRTLEIVGNLGINIWKNKTTNQIIVNEFEVKSFQRKSVQDLF